jgi:probable F420-dependent oxidoreductase
VVASLARTAERLGFDWVTVSDHVVLPTRCSAPYPYDTSGTFPGGAHQPYLESLALASWLLAATRRIHVAISVLVVPYRNPVVTAKQVATIDVLSGGRFALGVGVGWWPEEFEALAAPPYAQRGAVTDEYVRLMKALWTEDVPRFEGKHYRVADVTMLPRPVQRPHPPIWVGGHSDHALRRTAALGDVWHPIGLRGSAGLAPAEMAERIARLRTLTREAGRHPAAVRVMFRAPIDLWPARSTPAAGGTERPLAGPPAKVAADLRAYRAAGVDGFIFDAPAPDVRTVTATMRRVAREVLPMAARRPRAGAAPAAGRR